MICFLIRRTLPFLLAITAAIAGPPGVGDKAPDFALDTPEGKNIRLSEMLSGKPVVLVVLRGYPGYQCPLCNRQAKDYIQNGAALDAMGASVLFVYPGPGPDLRARAQEFLSDKKLPKNFHLLLDPDYRFTSLYDLRWDAPQETAYPSTFIIDPRGLVLYANISKSHGGRVKVADVLSVLKKNRNADQ